MTVSRAYLPQHTALVKKFIGAPSEVLAESQALLTKAQAHHGKRAPKASLVIWGVALAIGWFIPFLLLAFFPLVWEIGRYLIFRYGDVELRKLSIVTELFDKLSEEFAEDSPVEAQVDFRGYAHAAPEKPEPGVQLYQHSWLEMKLPLGDGGAIGVSAKTDCKRKLKRGRRSKNNDKLRESLLLTLSPPKGRRFNSAQKNRIARALVKIPDLELRKLTVSPKSATIEWRTPRRMFRSLPRSLRFVGSECMLHSDRVLKAVVLAYRALAASSAARGSTEAAQPKQNQKTSATGA